MKRWLWLLVALAACGVEEGESEGDLEDAACSLACAEEGECEDTGECEWEGQRAYLDGVSMPQTACCQAVHAADCASSRLCAHSGICSLHWSGVCHAASDLDCASSEVCRDYGHCTACGGICLPSCGG
jgi:hypothetical protein